MFVTDRRLLVRNPKMLGLSENIEDYPYDQITRAENDEKPRRLNRV